MKGVTRQTGIISDIDEAVVRVRVTLPECDNLRSNWLAVLQRNTQDNKDYWLPDIGEQVEVCSTTTARMGWCWARSTPAWIPRRWPRATSATCSFPTARPLNMTVRYTAHRQRRHRKIVIEVKERTQLTSPQVEIRAQHVTVISETVDVAATSVGVKAVDVNVEAPHTGIKALNVTVDAPLSTFTGDVTVMKNLRRRYGR